MSAAPGWVDTHCHLFMADEPVGVMLDRATASDVRWVVCPGVDAETSRKAAEIARLEPERVIATAGLHPHDAQRWDEQRETIEALAADAGAIGECGLDFYRNLAPVEAQLHAFRGQLDLARRLSKPIIVHCRDAFREVYEEVENAGLGENVVLHCWTGGPKWTRRFDELGVVFSFAGPVAFPNGDTVRRGAEVAPPDRTIIETDTPYLTPPPHRGQANEPAFVPLVGDALAGVWGLAPDAVARLTTATATRVFGRPV